MELRVRWLLVVPWCLVVMNGVDDMTAPAGVGTSVMRRSAKQGTRAVPSRGEEWAKRL